MDIKIRKATLEDVDKAFAVMSDAFAPELCATYENYKQRIETFPETFLLAETDGKVVGIINGGAWDNNFFGDILYEDIKSHKPDGLYQSICALAVIDDYKKRGIAASLLEEIIKVAKKDKRRGIILSCKEELIGFYSRFGFVHTGKSNYKLGEEDWNDMLLELSYE